jgi:hypothetical protein
MQRAAFSFALAVLSLLSSYVIAAKWPDQGPVSPSIVASTPSSPVDGANVAAAVAMIVGPAN